MQFPKVIPFTISSKTAYKRVCTCGWSIEALQGYNMFVQCLQSHCGLSHMYACVLFCDYRVIHVTVCTQHENNEKWLLGKCILRCTLTDMKKVEWILLISHLKCISTLLLKKQKGYKSTILSSWVPKVWNYWLKLGLQLMIVPAHLQQKNDCKSSLFKPIFTFLVMWCLLMIFIIILAAKEEVRWSSIKSNRVHMGS